FSYEQMALDVVKKMPAWSPGHQTGIFFTTSRAIWSAGCPIPFSTSKSDNEPSLSTMNATKTFPSQHLACGYSRFLLIKSCKASCPPGKVGGDSMNTHSSLTSDGLTGGGGTLNFRGAISSGSVQDRTNRPTAAVMTCLI